AYVLQKDVVDLIEPDRNVSIEREIWPQLVGDGLYAFPHEAYWLDIGTPERYLQATFDVLEGQCKTELCERLGDTFTLLGTGVENRGRVVPPAVVGRGTTIAPGAHVGSLVVLGDAVTVGEGATIERSVVMQGTDVGPGCVLRGCVVAAGSRIGAGTHITGGAVLGEGVTVGADNVLTRGVRVFPHVTIPDGGIRF
ncbi:MAG TPA: NDP-sugar synthase, partial [Solirubrobacteraceae bacterium]|nr:NDP-sugar synthase [Solirubrobacteraceae bacterium]